MLMFIPLIIKNIDVADVNADVLRVCGMHCMSVHPRKRDLLFSFRFFSFSL